MYAQKITKVKSKNNINVLSALIFIIVCNLFLFVFGLVEIIE